MTILENYPPIQALQTILEEKTQGLLSSGSTTLKLTLSWQPALLSALTFVLVKEIILPLFSLGDEVVNIEGRELASTPLIPEMKREIQNEIFYVKGLRTLTTEEKQNKVEQEFSISLSSHFSRFDSKNNLVEKVETYSGPETPEWVSLKNIANIFPFTPSVLRYGVHLFENKRMSSLLGAAPVINGGIFLEATPHKLSISAEDIPSKSSPMPRAKNFARCILNLIQSRNLLTPDSIAYRNLYKVAA